MKLKAVEFYVSLIMMGFCINLFTVDANFDMGPRSIFFIDGQFLTILGEFVFIFANITYTWFAIAEKGRERVEITSSGKNSPGTSYTLFLRFRHFFHIKCFPDQNYLRRKTLPDEKFCPKNRFSEDTLIYVENL